jgi:hypothetical protein
MYPEMVDKTGKKDPKEEEGRRITRRIWQKCWKSQKKNKELYKSAYGENEGSPDGSPDGTLSSAAKPGSRQLLSASDKPNVQERVEIPRIIAKEELPTLECTIEFRIDKNGKIKKSVGKKRKRQRTISTLRR